MTWRLEPSSPWSLDSRFWHMRLWVWNGSYEGAVGDGIHAKRNFILLSVQDLQMGLFQLKKVGCNDDRSCGDELALRCFICLRRFPLLRTVSYVNLQSIEIKYVNLDKLQKFLPLVHCIHWLGSGLLHAQSHFHKDGSVDWLVMPLRLEETEVIDVQFWVATCNHVLATE